MGATAPKRKRRRLKKSARRTIAALLMVTALIVAAIPVEDVKAEPQTATELSFPSGPDDPKIVPIDGLSVPNDSSKWVDGYLLDENDNCILDDEFHLPIPLYKIDKDTNGTQNAALTAYNENAVYVMEEGVLPLNNLVGFETASHPITKTVTYTIEEQDTSITENVVMLERTEEVVYDKTEAIISGSVPATYKKSEITSPYKCSRNDNMALITAIADNALAGKTNLYKINIPTYIRKIGNGAFRGCTALQSATFETNLEFIGNHAFAECGDLNSVQFVQPSGCATLGSAAFALCKGLTSFEFPSGVVRTGDGLFYGCSHLANAEMTKTANNNNLTGYKTMGSYTFMNCGNLGSVIMNPYVTTVGEGTFAGCEELKNATMPSELPPVPAVTYAKDTFWNCRKLDYVKVMHANSAFADPEEFSSIPVGDRFYIWGPDPNVNPSAIYDYAADLAANYTYYFEDSNGGHYEKTINGFKFTVDKNGKIDGFKITSSVPGGSTLEIPAVIGPFDVKSIGDKCFSDIAGNDKISTVNIPMTIEAVGFEAFARMPSLQTVNIKTDGVSFDSNCFKDCPNLNTVNFTQITNPAGETTIGPSCFSGCRNLQSVSFRNDDFTQGEIFDVNVTNIGKDAFYTTGSGLTMKGKIDTEYVPFQYATNKDNKVNDTASTQYIKYVSGNPTNLECAYDPALNDGAGAVSLLTYPDTTTIVNTVSGNSVQDIIDWKAGGAVLTQVQQDIIDNTARITLPAGITSIANTEKGTQDLFRAAPDGLATVTLLGVTSLPTHTTSGSASGNSGAFANNTGDLSVVNFGTNITDIGTLPFYDASSIQGVNFSDAEIYPGTIDDKYYWCEKGIIFSSYVDDAGNEVVTLEEVLPSRSDIYVTADETQAVTQIAEKAFQNCDNIRSVDFSTASGLKSIPKDCFYDCNSLAEVILPSSVNNIEARAFGECDDFIKVTIPAREVYINNSAFENDGNATVCSYKDSAAERYAADHTNVTFMLIPDTFTVTFADYDGTVIETQTVTSGEDAKPPADPVRTGYTFTGWRPNYTEVTSNRICIAQYTSNSSTSSTTSRTSTTSGTSGTSGTNRTTSSSRSTSSSSTSSSSSSSSSTVASTTIVSTTAAGTATGRTGSSGTNRTGSTGGNSNTGGTKIISNTAGISDIGKISATVNGSTDSYVIKITDSAEATAAVEQALIAEYGSLDPIRYLPMDISIYDSTGTTKISPLPDGVSVSITLPIPDELAIYGGNAKPANAEGGVLSKMNPRFTVINGVPCMTFTATHFSPYVVYVDTSNLSAAGSQDATPVTGDPIHPKWFLVIGLAAFAVVLFLKRDKEDKLKMA